MIITITYEIYTLLFFEIAKLKKLFIQKLIE